MLLAQMPPKTRCLTPGATILLAQPPGFNPYRAEGLSGMGRGDLPPTALWVRRLPNPLLYPCHRLALALGCGGGTAEGCGGLSNPLCVSQALLKPGEDSWSLAELVQALVLLTHYHSLASFVFGCGIKPEEEQDVGNSCWSPSPHSDSSPASDDSMGGSGVRGALPCRAVSVPWGAGCFMGQVCS